jgi:octaprenyl-diphosphate synthase
MAGRIVAATEIFELVRRDLQQVDHEIRLRSVASVDAITTISRYLHEGGGKRLRPTLLLLSSRLVGDGGAAAIRLAAVVEMIHMATLVHDDIIDVAQIRRGRPSPNVLWGNHTSVLAGDWLYMQAFQAALEERNFHVLDLLIGLTQMMVEGELLQLERLGRIDISEPDSMELIDRKTASLFSACTRLGGIAGGATTRDVELLGEFGWNLGMAFQLIDDILDFTSRESVLGKPVGNDLREGKVTLPLIYALEHATADERQMIQRVLNTNAYDETPFERVLKIVERYGGIERTRQRASQFTSKARDLLATFPDSPAQRALQAATNLVADRDR